MKSALPVLVAAAGVQQASATFGGNFNFNLGWSSASTFSCPSKIINICTPDQESDWDWEPVPIGSLTSWGGFNFGGGWSCENNLAKRGDVQGRTFFGLGKKMISGSCNEGDDNGLSLSVGANAGVDAFSIKSFDMSTEFDARLEFHYDMPDGSVCKQTSDCKKGGSTITNNQCGGAKKVRVIYPKQIIKKGLSFKKKCKISCHKIKWHCGKPTPKPSTPVPTLPGTTTQVIQTTPVTTLQTYTTPSQQTTPGKETTPAKQTTPSKETTPAQQTTPGKETTPAQTTPGKETTPAQTTPGKETTSAQQTTPGKETTPAQTTPGKETTPAQTTPGKETTPAQTTPGKETTPAQTTPGQQTTPGKETTAATTPASTYVTTYDSTSTVFTTSTKTITSCGPEVTECPGKTGPHIVTVTIPVSTTICPVTETLTPSQAVPTTVILPPKSETTVQEKPTGDKPTGEKPTGEKPNPVTSQPPQSTQTPPCPPVVPSCLNTFLDKAKCKDNTDASCFCPDKEFVKTIFECIYAHGADGNIVSEAVSFFQGVCGPYIPQNPVIATGAETITQIITVTGTPRITQVPYTTVVVATTVTENSSVQTISTEVTIPNIVMPTPTGGLPNQPPATSVPVPAGQNPPPAVTDQSPPPAVTDQIPPPAVTGTGGVIPPKPTGSVPVTAGSGRVGAGLGMVLAVVAFAVAL